MLWKDYEKHFADYVRIMHGAGPNWTGQEKWALMALAERVAQDVDNFFDESFLAKILGEASRLCVGENRGHYERDRARILETVRMRRTPHLPPPYRLAPSSGPDRVGGCDRHRCPRPPESPAPHLARGRGFRG